MRKQVLANKDASPFLRCFVVVVVVVVIVIASIVVVVVVVVVIGVVPVVVVVIVINLIDMNILSFCGGNCYTVYARILILYCFQCRTRRETDTCKDKQVESRVVTILGHSASHCCS